MCKDSIIHFKLTRNHDSLFIIIIIIITIIIIILTNLNNLNNSPKPKLHIILNVFNYVHIQRQNQN
ncbi:MAG: hypothetical protein K7J15_05650, partial [Candidatus Regiella insecticola]|nr:hypothetical protein [Candidatus Regiella insecticola]